MQKKNPLTPEIRTPLIRTFFPVTGCTEYPSVAPEHSPTQNMAHYLWLTFRYQQGCPLLVLDWSMRSSATRKKACSCTCDSGKHNNASQFSLISSLKGHPPPPSLSTSTHYTHKINPFPSNGPLELHTQLITGTYPLMTLSL